MKTSTAMTAHALVGAAQAAAMTQSVGTNPAIPWWGQLLIQIGMMLGQMFLAKANSESDQNGNPLPKE